jgi:hypothetical protein
VPAGAARAEDVEMDDYELELENTIRLLIERKAAPSTR